MPEPVERTAFIPRDDDWDDEASFNRSDVRGFLWTLFIFKIATVIAIAWAAGGSHEAAILLSATTWPWLIIPLIALAGPLLYQYRVRRVRRRKAELQRSEWMLSDNRSLSNEIRKSGIMTGEKGELTVG